MADTEDFKALRRLALASLGRNILHFQRVEMLLKRLVLVCDFAALSSEFASRRSKRAEELRTTTMGNLVNELHQRLYGKPTEPDTGEVLTETIIQFQLKIDADPGYIARQKQQLSDLVVERNNLIHQDLAHFDPNSEVGCRQWITRLDEQNERIIAQHRALQQIVDTHNKASKELFAFMETEDFKREFAPRAKG